MFHFLKRKKTEEERYLEDLERRRKTAAADLPQGGSDFELTVDDTFSIRGRGTVVTGTVSRGRIAVGDPVLIQGRGGTQRARVGGIESVRKMLEHAQAGDKVGILLNEVTREQVRPGDVLRGTHSPQ